MATVKPLILALRNQFDYQVKYLVDRVKKQDDSLLQLQTQVTELNTNVIAGTQAYLETTKHVQELENKMWTYDQVQQLSRRCQQLEMVAVELYSLVHNKLPNEDMPDMDPWLPTDPLPTAQQLESKWRELMNVDPDTELTEEQQQIADEYIRSEYLRFPRIPEYPTNDDGSFLTDEQIETFWYETNQIEPGTELTEAQLTDIQAYKDAYKYVYRQAPTEEPTP